MTYEQPRLPTLQGPNRFRRHPDSRTAQSPGLPRPRRKVAVTPQSRDSILIRKRMRRIRNQSADHADFFYRSLQFDAAGEGVACGETSISTSTSKPIGARRCLSSSIMT